MVTFQPVDYSTLADWKLRITEIEEAFEAREIMVTKKNREIDRARKRMFCNGIARIEHDQSRSPDVARIEGWSCAAARSRGHPVNWQTTPWKSSELTAFPPCPFAAARSPEPAASHPGADAFYFPHHCVSDGPSIFSPLQIFEQLAPTRTRESRESPLNLTPHPLINTILTDSPNHAPLFLDDNLI